MEANLAVCQFGIVRIQLGSEPKQISRMHPYVTNIDSYSYDTSHTDSFTSN